MHDHIQSAAFKAAGPAIPKLSRPLSYATHPGSPSRRDSLIRFRGSSQPRRLQLPAAAPLANLGVILADTPAGNKRINFWIQECYTFTEMKGFGEKEPWYAAGLAFECVQCGRCCAGPEEGYVYVTREEIDAIARHLGISPEKMRRKFVRRAGLRFSLIEKRGCNDCIFLKAASEGGAQTCRIYPVRPTQCRSWPFWPINLAGPDSWSRAATRCGGINRGRLYSCEEIEDMRKATAK